MIDADAVVYRWPKNAREEVRASLATYNGHRLADIRVYVVDEHGEAIPTRKGLAVRVESLDELRESVDALIAAVRLEAA